MPPTEPDRAVPLASFVVAGSSRERLARRGPQPGGPEEHVLADLGETEIGDDHRDEHDEERRRQRTEAENVGQWRVRQSDSDEGAADGREKQGP